MGRQKLKQSFSAAVAGINYVFIRERNMKIHFIASILAVLFGCILNIERLEWGLLFITIFFVLVAETVNTAIEETVNLITVEYHPLAKITKNLAAGAVLLSAINSIIMGFIIFGPYLF